MRAGAAGRPERVGELLESGQCLALVGQPARLLARERLGRVARGELHELPLLPSLSDPEVDRAAATLREERLQVADVRSQRRDVHLARDRRRAGVVLLEEAGEDLVVAGLARRIEQEDVAPHHLAVADREQLDRGLVVLSRQADDVELGPGEPRHLLALHRPLDGPDLVAQDGRSLVLEAVRRRAHLGLEGLDERLLTTLEEELHLRDVGAVRVLRDRLDARTLALLDVVQEARPLERPLAVLDVDRAGPEREQPPDQVHRLVDAHGGGIRPEVAAAVVRELPGPLDAREVVGQRDLDVRVALVVLEPDVEPWLEPLDEVGFEEECLRHRVGQRVFDLGDTIDDAADAVDLAGRRRPSASTSARGCAGSAPCRRRRPCRGRPSSGRRRVGRAGASGSLRGRGSHPDATR